MTKSLQSWGRYPYHPQVGHPVAWRDGISSELNALAASYGTILPYGNGRSYGSSCLAASNHVLHARALDRFIAADWHAGVIRVESGVTLGEILEVAIPRGWMLPVTPGTKYVTIGGAIANDVHGKNHHVRGTFGCHVRRFGLIRSQEGEIECGFDENRLLFDATVGGLGLTGVIAWAEIALMPIRSSQIRSTSIRFASLSGFFELADDCDAKHEYSVAWIDCLASGASLGRGIFMAGDHAVDGTLVIDRTKKKRVPFVPPISPINSVTLSLFNEAYYRFAQRSKPDTLVSYDKYFYPLDSILEWNRIYGKAGFQQYQCVVPKATAIDAMREILSLIAHSKTGSFLAVLKRCGDVPSPGLISFPLEGTSLALDFPQHDDANRRLFASLDAVVRDAGGRLYPAKDAHMSGADFRATYSRWSELETLRDPAIMSQFWKNVIQ
ncbi:MULTISPECIES: FAD-binding oxidoreductase [Burkholderia]|uniref:FAD-binding oxidoreductase n=1 Tax=Burkholderia TaxID=32008 RepID=UPI000552AB83|nr:MULTISPECIES: FAD-binding oxidoreductase [Burkholderia]HDR9081987.1 FAD-binding oxidoreductase [Burkholderia vietnamiensis]